VPEKLTPEEYQQLAHSPADSAVVMDGPDDAPEGVVEEEADTSED